MDQQIISINEGWRFFLGECEDAWYKGYDDTAFQQVTVPHDWAVAYPFSQTYSSGTGYLAGGVGWYRLHFKVPEAYRGKRIRILFEGVYKKSQVWVNSYYFGKHPNGYTGFSYDLSEVLYFGEEVNVVCVKVNHTDIADSRWFTGSGIYRKVSLIIEEVVHPVADGIYLTTERASSEQATLTIHHEVINQSAQDHKVVVETHLLDAAQNVVGVWQGIRMPRAGETGNVVLQGEVVAPRV